jgi:hypothetical protein
MKVETLVGSSVALVSSRHNPRVGAFVFVCKHARSAELPKKSRAGRPPASVRGHLAEDDQGVLVGYAAEALWPRRRAILFANCHALVAPDFREPSLKIRGLVLTHGRRDNIPVSGCHEAF